MKNKIMVIIIVILSIINTVSISMLIYQSNSYVKIPKQYKCETKETETDNIKYQQIIILNINQEQYIENYQNQNITKYDNQEMYDSAKQIENTENVTYSFDDNTKTLISDYKVETLKDSEGNSIDVWYKDYIKSLEKAGFTCQVLK